MHTSAYSSSPVRTLTSETIPTNYQYQFSHNINSSKINDSDMALRRNADSYSHSTSPPTQNPYGTPTLTRKYTNNYYNSSNDLTRFPSTAYSSTPYRSYQNDNDAFRSVNSRYDLSANNRAYSCDDIYNEQHSRFQPSLSNTRYTNQYKQQQTIKRDQYYQYDNDDELVVKSTDLSARLEQEMIEIVRMAFRKSDITNQRELAGFLKRSADKKFSPCWHCIVGRQFSSYVTHEMNGFIYFTKGSLSLLLFRSGP